MIEFKREPVRPDEGPVRTELRSRLREAFPDRPPEIVNTDAQDNLLNARVLLWREQLYDIPPMDWTLSLRLDLLLTQITAIGLRKQHNPEDVQALVSYVRAAVALMRKLVRPHSRWRRLVWPFTRNPFRKAGDAEIGQLLGFFWRCRTADARPKAADPSA